MKHLLVILFFALMSCSTAKYGFLPGTDYKFYKPIQNIDLQGARLSLEFVDNRDNRDSIVCSEHNLDLKTELEGGLGFSYFKEYIQTMIKESNGILDTKSETKIKLKLEALSFKLIGFGYIVAHGFIQFEVKSDYLDKRYCSDMTDKDEDAPLKWYSFVTRKTASRIMVSGSSRRAIEELLVDLQKQLN